MKRYTVNDNLKLFNSYTNAYREEGSTRYTDFSGYSPFSVETVIDSIEEAATDIDRNALCAALSEYNSGIGAGELVINNIELLRNNNTFAVITGHQPALFGGPLFLALKIASVISAVQQLNQQQESYRFVPVFWNASEDHNSAEFGNLSLYDKSNDIRNISINLNQKAKMASHITGSLVNTVLDDLFAALPFTEFTASIKNEIIAVESADLAETFSRLIGNWFSEYGLIIIEPKALRTLAAPVLLSALQCHDEMINNMTLDSEYMLAAGFKPQLPYGDGNNTFLFYLNEGIRYRIRKENDRFIIADLNLSYSMEEIADYIRNEPERFSPVAGLRPIVQASIFPVVCYVAGGGELAYHYQLRRNFRLLQQHLPLILPRISGTFVTPSINKLLEKFSLSLEDVFNSMPDWEMVEKRLLLQNNELKSIFDDYFTRFAGLNSNFAEKLSTIGITKQNEFQREVDKYNSRIEMLQKRFATEALMDGEGVRKRFYKLQKFLFPAEKYQELNISSLYFYSLLGQEFFTRICEADVFSKQHNIWVFD